MDTQNRTCDMEADCMAFPSHIGSKGYIYCAAHAVGRRESGYERTRKMRPWELRWIAAGKALPAYAVGPEPVADAAPKLAADNAALLAALEALTDFCTSGRRYETQNPYTVKEIVGALDALRDTGARADWRSA